MHEKGHSIVSGCKDGSTLLHVLMADGRLLLKHLNQGMHDGVVKCVRWRDGSSFATCGNDR